MSRRAKCKMVPWGDAAVDNCEQEREHGLRRHPIVSSCAVSSSDVPFIARQQKVVAPNSSPGGF